MTASQILASLAAVEGERQQRRQDSAWVAAVTQVKDYQHRRFAQTYADLLDQPRYAGAARFFLDDIYGPKDFSDRDAQFARVVPALVRLFPRDTVQTIVNLGELHALSERLDSAMGRHVKGVAVDRWSYASAWKAVGEVEARERQIQLLVAVGSALDHLTGKRLLRQTLHLMRGPANAAGLGQLQQFLERGFDTFKAMAGASDFLRMVGERERRLAASLFAAPDPLLQGADPDTPASRVLDAWLP
jgi:hypothetical protein